MMKAGGNRILSIRTAAACRTCITLMDQHTGTYFLSLLWRFSLFWLKSSCVVVHLLYK